MSIIFNLLISVKAENLTSIVINLFSDFLSTKLGDRKMRKHTRKFRRELVVWLKNFQNEHDGSILISGTYLRYISNYRIIEQIYQYAFSKQEKLFSEDEFIRNIVEGSRVYLKTEEVAVKNTDEQILKEFYCKILDKFKKYIKDTEGQENLEILYSLNQLRCGQKKMYERLQTELIFNKKALERIEKIYIQAMEIIQNYGPNLDDEWFLKQNKYAICNMGDRYISELNINLPIQNDINIIAADKDFFDDLRNKCNELLISMGKMETKDINVSEYRKQLLNILSSMNHFSQFNKSKDKFVELLNQISFHMQQNINDIINHRRDERDFTQQRALRYYFEIRGLAKDIEHYITKNVMQLLQYPILLIYGKGGVGKSHLIADTVAKRGYKKEKSILLLGQDFPENCIIWSRCAELLQLGLSEEKFLTKLDSIAEVNGNRILLFIDAINEGGGRELWKNRLEGVIKKIIEYPNLGLVFSVRNEFLSELIPNSLLDKYHITKLEHLGFGEFTMEAVQRYFAHYDIDMSILPYLPKEFSNGLFLRLFCEGYQGRNRNDISISTEQIYENYLKNLNIKLADKYQYSREYNFVGEVLQVFVKESYKKNIRNKMDKQKAIDIVFSIATKYHISTQIYDKLLEEGVLTQTLDYDGNEYVYITYERLADYIFAISKMEIIKNRSVSDDDLLRQLNHPGIIEELSCILPGYGEEVFERFPQICGNRRTSYALIESLAWRTDYKLYDDKLLDYINKYIMIDEGLSNHFIECLIWMSTNQQQPFNGRFFHENMMSLSMADRDASYMKLFNSWNNEGSPIAHLLDWIDLVEKGTISVEEENIYLCALVLGWMLISTDNFLRDKVSVALCTLLRGHVSVMLSILRAFENVNDSYIIERLYTIALGVVTFERESSAVRELSIYIYEKIFSTASVVVEDILVRDSAKEVIMYALSLEEDGRIDIGKVVGPYNSSFPDVPKDEEIEKYYLDYEKQGFKDYYWAQNNILSSMQVDTKGYHYGDFGRYTFQRYFCDWNNLNASELMKIAIYDIFKKGYNVDIHGYFDRNINQYERISERKIERIGKKYQWQSLYKLAAQVSDNYQRKNEAIGEMEYNTGAYEPRLRDFDPTVNQRNFVGKFGEMHDISYNNYDLEHEVWLSTYDDLPLFRDLVKLNISGKDYLSLYGYYEWKESTPLGMEEFDCPLKEMWFMSFAYIVREEDFGFCKQQLQNENFWGRWMPEASDNYSLYNREYYWSDAQKYYENEYYGGNEWKKIWNTDNEELEKISFLVPVYSYVSTGEKRFTNLNYNSWKKPCRALYFGLDLQYGEENTVMYDKEGNMMCFDAMEIFGKDRGFFFNKMALEKFLTDNHYRLIWAVLGEKRIIGGSNYRKINYTNRPEYTGFFYLEGGEIKGNISVM